MTKEQDNWGRDLAVQHMRKVFAGMEHAHKTLLAEARLSPFDGRLRFLRETALELFDRATARAAGKSIRLTDIVMIGIYTGCLQQAMENAGIAVSKDLLPDDRALRELVREVSR